jgi:hypothetical protein
VPECEAMPDAQTREGEKKEKKIKKESESFEISKNSQSLL